MPSPPLPSIEYNLFQWPWNVQTMLKDGFQPNVFIYNSMMNVNVGDLVEVQRYYQHMQVAIF